jgi:hypothetical protein
MALIASRFDACAAALAASSMLAMPAAAAELPQIPTNTPAQATAYDGTGENMDGYRRYRRHRGPDAGDVIAGVVVLGAIAAIASSASNNRDRDRRREDVRYREPAPRSANGWGSGGIDRAVDMCVVQVERGRDLVDSVDNASRDGSGWNVSGSLTNGDYFSCRIDNEGRIRAIDLGDNYSAYGAAAESGPQWSDEDYAAARASVRSQGSSPAIRGGAIDADLEGALRPAYPGGPLPGEEGYEESLGG